MDSINYKAHYDTEFNHIGFTTEDDPRVLGVGVVLLTSDQWLDLMQEDDLIIYDSVTPADLTKIKIQARPPLPDPEWVATEKLKSEKKAKKDKATAKVVKMSAIELALKIPKSELLSVRHVFNEWADLIGIRVTKASDPYILHLDRLFETKKNHTPTADKPPESTPEFYSEVLT